MTRTAALSAETLRGQVGACVAALATVAAFAGFPCSVASTAARRSGTGAMPPAVRRMNWNVPSLTTARAQISTSGHSAWVRLMARLYSARSPFSAAGSSMPLINSPGCNALSAVPSEPSPNNSATVRRPRRSVTTVAS